MARGERGTLGQLRLPLRLWLSVLLLAACLAGGCKSSGGGGGGGADGGGAGGGANGSANTRRPAADATGAKLRSEAMAAADAYALTTIQALDELRDRTRSTKPQIARWALDHKIASAGAAFTNATQASDAAALLDMLVLATLKRHAVEEHWVPHLLHEDGAGLLAAQRQAETDIWASAEKVLTRKQLNDMRALIEQWRREHPTQYYVGLVRLADIAGDRQLSKGSAQLKLPNSIFGLLYMDPLSGLDPVAAELRSYRQLTERMMYLATRMPLVFGAQIERATDDATSTPEILRALSSVEKFNETISRFTDVTAGYPKQFSTASAALVEQSNAAVTEQRKAILAELDAQESRVNRISQQVNAILDRADKAGVSINTATTQTVTTTEQATRRTMDRAFWLALALILLLLIGIPASAIAYRYAAANWDRASRRRKESAPGAS